MPDASYTYHIIQQLPKHWLSHCQGHQTSMNWPMSQHETLFSSPLLRERFVHSFIHSLAWLIFTQDTYYVYWFTMDVLTKYHRLVVLNNRNLSSYSSGGYKSKIRLLAGLVSSEGCEGESVFHAALPNFWWFAGNLWCSLFCRSIFTISAFIFIQCSPWIHVYVQTSPFSKDTNRIRLGPHPTSSMISS